jgi:hypothetical protein
VTLRLASSRAAQGGPRAEGKARAALAELCVLQGRLTEAERLIGDRRDHSDVVLPFARLHLARGEYEEAIGVAGVGGTWVTTGYGQPGCWASLCRRNSRSGTAQANPATWQ